VTSQGILADDVQKLLFALMRRITGARSGSKLNIGSSTTFSTSVYETFMIIVIIGAARQILGGGPLSGSALRVARGVRFSADFR